VSESRSAAVDSKYDVYVLLTPEHGVHLLVGVRVIVLRVAVLLCPFFSIFTCGGAKNKGAGHRSWHRQAPSA
jgi:hypothetical protein